MSAHTKTATALLLAGITVTGLPAALAEEANTEPNNAVTASEATEEVENTPIDEIPIEPVPTETPTEDDAISPIDVVPIDTPTPPAADPSPTPTTPPETNAPEEPTNPVEAEPAPTPSETTMPETSPTPTNPALPVEPIETQDPSTSPTPVPVETVPTETPSPTQADSQAPTAPHESPSPEAENTLSATESPNETAAADPSNAAPVREQALPPATEALPQPQVDEAQNIILTGAVTEQTTDEVTGVSTIITEETTAEGHQLKTEYVTAPETAQTTVRQTLTDSVTGQKTVTERTVPATTFKAGGAASIDTVQNAHSPATETKQNNTLAGWLISALALALGVGAYIQRQRSQKTAQ